MAWTIFIVNAGDRACVTYYSGNLRFDHMSNGLLFRFPVKFLDTLSYFGLNKFALWVVTDPMLAALATKRCIEVDWEEGATKNGFVIYDFTSRKMLALNKESV